MVKINEINSDVSGVISYKAKLEEQLKDLGKCDLSEIYTVIAAKLNKKDAIYRHCKCEELGDNLVVTLQNGVESVFTFRGYKGSEDFKMLYRRETESALPPKHKIYGIVNEADFYKGYSDSELKGLLEVVTGILDVVPTKNN